MTIVIDSAAGFTFPDGTVQPSAVPFEALAYNGLQVNGSCIVDQLQIGNVSVTGAHLYGADVWSACVTGGLEALASSLPLPVAMAQPLPGFSNFFRIYVTLATATMPVGAFGYMRSIIEGYRAACLGWGAAGAMPATIGFWVHSSLTGTFTLCVTDGVEDNTSRRYLTPITINNAFTWEYKTVTIPGDVGGTVWNKTNGRGMTLYFTVGAGTNLQASANTWLTTGALGVSGTGNFFSVAGAQVAITGLIVLPGTQAPSAARSPYIQRPFDHELMLCQRYYEKSYDYAAAAGAAATNGTWEQTVAAGGTGGFFQSAGANFRVRKRVVPSMSVYSQADGQPGTAFQVGYGNVNCGVECIGETGCGFYFTTAVGTPTLRLHWVADARF